MEVVLGPAKMEKKEPNFYFYNENNLWEHTDIGKIILKISIDLKNHIKTLHFDNKEKIIDKLETYGDASSTAKYVSDLIDEKDFDKDINKQKYVLPIKGKKVIDLRTNKVRDRKPEDKFDYECDAHFLENMTPETEGWKYAEKYFLDLFCDNKKLTQVFINTIKSCLQGFPIKNLFIAIGPNGNNGKSFLFNLLKLIFGKAFDIVSPEIIIKNKSGGSSINTQFEKTEKCRVAYMSEPDKGDILNSKDIKKITGKDGIDLRALWATNRTIFATCCLWMLTNVLPTFSADKAINNRLCLFPFNNSFEENPDFEDEIKTKYNEIFTYLMKKGRVCSKIEMTPEMIAIKEKYINDNDRDTLRDFIKEKTVKTEGKKITRDDMRKRFNEYCQAHGFSNETRNWSPNKFTSALKEYGITCYNKGENRCWYENIDWVPNYYNHGVTDEEEIGEIEYETQELEIEFDTEIASLEEEEHNLM
jgi:P4 family phage/plasmid primase-like protien